MAGAVHAHLAELVGGLACHGAVALHDPGGNFLIALPGGILHHHAVLGLGGFGGGHTDAFVVVHILDGDLRALFPDVFKPALAAIR